MPGGLNLSCVWWTEDGVIKEQVIASEIRLPLEGLCKKQPAILTGHRWASTPL